VGIGVTLADGTKSSTKISVAKPATTVAVTWTELGIASAARIVGIWGYFQSGESNVTDDLVISAFGLK
jgi:hypothetical protein